MVVRCVYGSVVGCQLVISMVVGCWLFDWLVVCCPLLVGGLSDRLVMGVLCWCLVCVGCWSGWLVSLMIHYGMGLSVVGWFLESCWLLLC